MLSCIDPTYQYMKGFRETQNFKKVLKYKVVNILGNAPQISFACLLYHQQQHITCIIQVSEFTQKIAGEICTLA